jgi:protein-L-isoaspartate O-methyltransferase
MLTQRVDLFDSTYGHFTQDVLAAIRRETFGPDIGQNSWLTVEEYDRFISWLKLQPEQHVLEVASGSGGPACTWPTARAAMSPASTATSTGSRRRLARRSTRTGRAGSASASRTRTHRCRSPTTRSMRSCASIR